MAYFLKTQDSMERRGKVIADIFCALVLGAFSVAFFGWLGGIAALIILEAGLQGVDYVMPDASDASGAVVR